jgi:hypothetical protein
VQTPRGNPPGGLDLSEARLAVQEGRSFVFLSTSYDPRDHLVASSDVTAGIGLSGALLACLMVLGGMGPASSLPDGTHLVATSVAPLSSCIYCNQPYRGPGIDLQNGRIAP